MVIFICQFTLLTSDWTGLMFIYECVCLCVVRLLFVHTEYSCHVTHLCNIYTSIANWSYCYTCITSHPAETASMNNVINIYYCVCNQDGATNIYIVTILHVMVDWCFFLNGFARRCMLCVIGCQDTYIRDWIVTVYWRTIYIYCMGLHYWYNVCTWIHKWQWLIE